MSFKMGEVRGELGTLYGCAMETYVVNWRIDALIDAIDQGDIAEAMSLAKDIKREVMVAELLRRPLPVMDHSNEKRN